MLIASSVTSGLWAFCLVMAYPFIGGKVWCRYWCPLKNLMQFQSKIFTRFGLSKFHIVANDKCIACNECSRNFQVGIDVM